MRKILRRVLGCGATPSNRSGSKLPPLAQNCFSSPRASAKKPYTPHNKHNLSPPLSERITHFRTFRVFTLFSSTAHTLWS